MKNAPVTEQTRCVAVHDLVTAVRNGLPHLTTADRHDLADALLADLPVQSRAMRLVETWHATAESMHPVVLTGPHNYPLRAALLREEAEEAAEAFEAGDLAHAAKELCDVLWVTYGAAIAAGIDLDAALEEVSASNLSKLPGCTLRPDGKLCKGPDYVAPDMSDFVPPTP